MVRQSSVYILTPTHGQELWVMTERTRTKITGASGRNGDENPSEGVWTLLLLHIEEVGVSCKG